MATNNQTLFQTVFNSNTERLTNHLKNQGFDLSITKHLPDTLTEDEIRTIALKSFIHELSKELTSYIGNQVK